MLKREDFEAKLRASFVDSVRGFKDKDYARHTDEAFRELGKRRPRIVLDNFLLVPGCSTYTCPNDLNDVQSCLWGRNHKAQVAIWADNRIGQLPDLKVSYTSDGSRVLQLVPMPSARDIYIVGYVCEYTYAASHIWTDKVCTLNAYEEGLLMLRAQAEAMRELGMKNVTTPSQLREGMSSTPKNGTPSYLFSVLMDEFDRKVQL